jgi:hypothetical protein
MPAPGTASYKRLYRRVLAALNALDLSTYMASTPTINDRRRVAGIARDSIVAADVFVQKLCCARKDNPNRARFVDYSSALSDDDEIPDHYGALGAVVIQKVTAGAFESAQEAETVEQINQWRENVGNVYGSIAHDAANSPLAGWFKIVGTRIRFTGYRAKVEIANIVVPGEADDPPTLYSPDAFEDVLFAHATSENYIEGDDMNELEKRRAYVQQMTPLILAGAMEVPPLQQK